jgi:hypothetical protein
MNWYILKESKLKRFFPDSEIIEIEISDHFIGYYISFNKKKSQKYVDLISHFFEA